MTIPFNKPYITGRELRYINKAIALGKLSAGGDFTLKCETLLKKKYGLNHCFLTTSCTSALEMATMIYDISDKDEIIIPSFTFVSTASAFARAGASIRFVDSLSGHPNMDCSQIEDLITPQTRAIVPVHYGGVACDMHQIRTLASKYNLYIIEDAAHVLHNCLENSNGISCFSFHETKNIQCGEGGMLGFNDLSLLKKADYIWNKGTNRIDFLRGKISEYKWVSAGSSFAPSEITAAFLYAQLEVADEIQQRRAILWQKYHELLQPLVQKGLFETSQEQGSSHIFYLLCHSKNERSMLIDFLSKNDIIAVFHYQSLHRSPFGLQFHDGRSLPNADRFSDSLIRLPLFYELTENQVEYIVETINRFYTR